MTRLKFSFASTSLLEIILAEHSSSASAADITVQDDINSAVPSDIDPTMHTQNTTRNRNLNSNHPNEGQRYVEIYLKNRVPKTQHDSTNPILSASKYRF